MPMAMSKLLLIGLGGGFGAIGRYLLGRFITRLTGAAFPWGTLAANVLGGLLMGILVGWLAARLSGGAENLRLALGVGLLGGFTTFSSFSLEALRLIETKAYGAAAGYISASVILSIFAVFIGLLIARRLFAL